MENLQQKVEIVIMTNHCQNSNENNDNNVTRNKDKYTNPYQHAAQETLQRRRQRNHNYDHEHRVHRRRIIRFTDNIRLMKCKRPRLLNSSRSASACQNFMLLTLCLYAILLSSFTTTIPSLCVCYAHKEMPTIQQKNYIYQQQQSSIISMKRKRKLVDEEAEDNQVVDDFYEIDDDDEVNNYTPSPTKYPTESPTNVPTTEPTRAGDDFYEVDIDDYTVEAQSAQIYISSISDVILCLLCTFFWVLWLVGTIFPTKIQYLYKSEGIVVIGDVLHSYVTHGDGGSDGVAARITGEGEGSPMININNDNGHYQDSFGNEESEPDMHGGGGGDTFDELNDIPSYHAIVSYVVPGPIAMGRRRKAVVASSPTQQRYDLQHEQPIPTSNYQLQTNNESNNFQMTTKSLHPITKEDHALKELNSKLSVDHVKATMQVLDGTPPRPPRTSSNISHHQRFPSPIMSSPRSRSESPESLRVKDGIRNRQLSKKSEEGRTNANDDKRVKNLLDTCTKSFDITTLSPTEKKKLRDEMDKLGYYKYNRHDVTEYASKDDPDEYEDPELIGNLFHSLGLSSMVMTKSKGSGKEASPVRVKKRFETHELLKQGSKNVEIIVLPGNPGSGILKSEFELEEDYMLHGTVSADVDGSSNPSDILRDANRSQVGDITAGIIGVVLASVSVIGAVHGVLTLPYQTRAFGWILVVFSLSLMWPTAMLTYKSVNRLRMFMMNKIISFEPCGEKTNLYGLSRLPRAKLSSCGDNNSGKGSDVSGAEYVIMLDTKDTDGRKGSQDEYSAVSSLSSMHQIV